jgi:hypothetical protein
LTLLNIHKLLQHISKKLAGLMVFLTTSIVTVPVWEIPVIPNQSKSGKLIDCTWFSRDRTTANGQPALLDLCAE